MQKLIKLLQKAAEEVGPRATVVLDLREFRLIGSEYTHWSIHDCKADVIRWAKDDSFELADGTERQKRVVVVS